MGRAGENLHEDAIFFLGPAVALDGGVELIMPALSALLSVSAREIGRNCRPPVLPPRAHSHSQSAFPRAPLPPPYSLLCCVSGKAPGSSAHARTRSNARGCTHAELPSCTLAAACMPSANAQSSVPQPPPPCGAQVSSCPAASRSGHVGLSCTLWQRCDAPRDLFRGRRSRAHRVGP